MCCEVFNMVVHYAIESKYKQSFIRLVVHYVYGVNWLLIGNVMVCNGYYKECCKGCNGIKCNGY